MSGILFRPQCISPLPLISIVLGSSNIYVSNLYFGCDIWFPMTSCVGGRSLNLKYTYVDSAPCTMGLLVTLNAVQSCEIGTCMSIIMTKIIYFLGVSSVFVSIKTHSLCTSICIAVVNVWYLQCCCTWDIRLVVSHGTIVICNKSFSTI